MTLMPFDGFDYRGTGAIVPFHFQDNQPEVFGNIDGIAARMTIDTGDSGSLLLIAPFARRYRLAERYHATIPYKGSAVTSTYGHWARVKTVQFDDIDGQHVAEVHQPLTRISDQHSGFDANRYVSANIGIGILKQFNVTFDYARRRIIFERSRSYGALDPFNRAGFSIQSGDKPPRIRAIYAGSPAQAAGLKEGMRVLSLNGRNTGNLTQDEVTALLIGPVGSALVVEFQQTDGSTHSRVLRLRDML